MNGLLTALLGGAAGAGQGIQYQDELAMKQQAQKMERLSMATEMIKNGITPPKDLLAGFDLGTPTQGPPQGAPQGTTPSGPDMQTSNGPPQSPTQGPGPSIPQGVLTGLLVRHGDGFVAAPNARQSAPPAMQQRPQPTVQATQPGGMSGTDAIRGAASSPGFMMPTPMSVGGLQVDLSRSLPYRTAMLGVAADQMKDQNQAAIAEQKIARDAQAILDANQVNPNTGRPFTPAEATNIARNHDLAMQRAPVLGTPGYTTAMGADRRQVTDVDLDKAIRMAPVTASTAAQTLAATTPGDVAKSAQTAAATASANPPEMQLRAAGALQTASHAKKTIDAFVKHYGAPGMMTQLAQKYPTVGNYLDSPEGQVLRNAAINFLDASMDASGQQRYNGSVLEQKIHALIPWGGDDPGTLQSKIGFINDAMHSMQVNAGAALPRGATVAPGAAPVQPPLPATPPATQAGAATKSGGKTITVNGKTFKIDG